MRVEQADAPNSRATAARPPRSAGSCAASAAGTSAPRTGCGSATRRRRSPRRTAPPAGSRCDAMMMRVAQRRPAASASDMAYCVVGVFLRAEPDVEVVGERRRVGEIDRRPREPLGVDLERCRDRSNRSGRTRRPPTASGSRSGRSAARRRRWDLVIAASLPARVALGVHRVERALLPPQQLDRRAAR